MWAGKGHTRTVLPRLGRCSWSDPARSQRDVAVPRMSHQMTLLRDAPLSSSMHVSKWDAVNAAQHVRPP